MNLGQIILIDDDHDDLDLMKTALKNLDVKNEAVVFDRATKAVEFFNETVKQPFFILCDINMPEIDGFELRRRLLLNSHLQIKTTPFLFLSTTSDHPFIRNAYELSIQGYFVKPSAPEEIEEMLLHINYWNISKQPTRNK